jgi:hypothetical protein
MTEGFPAIRHFSVYLDSEDLLEVELAAKDQKFRFPVSFASDMSQISILRSLYWVDGLGTVMSQKVGLNPAARNNNQDVAAEPRSPRPSATRAKYRRLFTPCGRYLAHLERQNDFNDSSEGLWTFGIWEKEASDIQFMGGSAWRQIATLEDVYGDFLIDGDITFNPQYQMIALMKLVPWRLGEMNMTSIWDFRAIPFGLCNDEKTTKMVYGTGLRNLSFSPCGRFLSGDHFHSKEKRVVNIERFTAVALPLMLPISDDLSNFGDPTTRTLQTPTNFARHSFLTESEQIYSTAQDHNRAAPSSNALTLGTRDGKPVLQTIRTYSDGAVVLKSYSSLVNTEECLLYLPNETQKSVSATVLHNDGDPDNVRIVLTPILQDTYEWGHSLSCQSVTVISRPIGSIQRYKVPHGDSKRLTASSNYQNCCSLLTRTGLPRRRAYANADIGWREPSDARKLETLCLEQAINLESRLYYVAATMFFVKDNEQTPGGRGCNMKTLLCIYQASCKALPSFSATRFSLNFHSFCALSLLSAYGGTSVT